MTKKIICLILGIAIVSGFGTWLFLSKYSISDSMLINISEIKDYPDDPAEKSSFYGRYESRRHLLTKNSDTSFTFTFTSDDPGVADITFKDIDLSLYIPTAPEWIKGDSNLEMLTFVNREWNRQQVTFDQRSQHFNIQGGDGFEKENLISAELARNCLNAGLWEVLLFTRENGKKRLYYQGWFNFPLGHYKKIFERQNQVSYWNYWSRLEHWRDPEGAPVDLNKLRQVINEQEVIPHNNPYENIIVTGEQKRKFRLMNAPNVHSWKDFYTGAHQITFATFESPGRYNTKNPWKNQYQSLASCDKAIVRKVRSSANNQVYDEVELHFKDADSKSMKKIIISGFMADQLPQISSTFYNKGLYMPMGIALTSYSLSYDELNKKPPQKSPYFSLILDSDDRFINHHAVAIDGPAMHRDIHDPNLLHIYLLSYERHTLINHFMIQMKKN